MTRELAIYISGIRQELQSKIQMLSPTPGMNALQVKRAQNLAADCKRLDVVIQQFELENAEAELRKRSA
jgi:hypothetical protein